MTVASAQPSTSVAAGYLGAPGASDPVRCSQAAIEVLGRVAGPEFRMTSLTLEVSSQPLVAGEVSIWAQADKRTRSIVFASAEAWQGGRLVFTAQGLFNLRREAG